MTRRQILLAGAVLGGLTGAWLFAGGARQASA